MKIQCEQCKIEYNIDDASIGERGIRAQCPRCNHITTIRKSQSAILDEARARLDVAICVNCGKPTDPNPSDPIPICAACQALSNTGEVGAKTTVSGGAPAPGMPAGGFGGTPQFGAPAPGGAGGIPPAQSYVPPAAGPAPAAGGAAPEGWRVKKAPGGDVYGPFDRDTLVGWVETDKIVPADEISRVGGPWKAAAEHEDFATLFAKKGYNMAPRPPAPPAGVELDGERPPPARPAPTGGIRGGGKPAPRAPVPKGVIFGVAAAVVMVGAVVTLGLKGMLRVPDLRPAPTPIVADATDKRLDAIRDEYPGVTGTSDEHFRAGLEHMEADTVAGWIEARGEFQQALALDRNNMDAMAGLAEANALLALYDQQSGYLDEAFRFSARAAERKPESAAAHRARAATMLLNPSPATYAEAQRVLTTQVLPASEDDPGALTMLGITWKETDPGKAEALFTKAIEKGPNLIRPRLELGMLYESTRRFQKALQTFKPIADRSYLASYRTGEIEMKVGNYKQAASAYRSAAKVAEPFGGRPWVEATVAAAVIQYQALGNVREADKLLGPLEAKYLAEGATERMRSDLLNRLRLHLAIVARLQGKFDRSLQLSQAVIDAREGELSPAAHFNAGLVQLRRADFDAAERSFEEADAPGIHARIRSEIYFWQARMRARRNDVPGAGAKYDDAIRADGHNWRAVVGYASLLVESLDRKIEGIDKLQDLARVDPDFYRQYQRVTLFYPDSTDDMVKDAIASFSRVYQSHQTDPRAASALGILFYLNGSSARAERFFQAALSEQRPDNAAYVFTGLIAESRGGKAGLARALQQYTHVKTSIPSPFLSTALGRVRTQRGEYEAAIGDYQEALQRSPDYAPAHYWLGVLYEKQGEKRQAVDKWADALKYDPNYLRASQAILEMGG